jgi:hypothetical protein
MAHPPRLQNLGDDPPPLLHITSSLLRETMARTLAI